MALFIAGAVLLCTVATVSSISDIQRSNHRERAKGIDIVMSNIGNNLNIAFDLKWENVRSFARRVAALEKTSEEELLQTLKSIQNESDIELAAIDGNGLAYYPDGSIEYWKEFGSTEYGQEKLMLSQLQFGMQGERMMVYIMPLETPLKIGSSEIIFMVVFDPISSYLRNFEAGNFGDNCLSFIVDKNGVFLFENGSDDDMASSYNLFAYVEKNVKFGYDASYEGFIEDINSGINGTAFVDYNGKPYYISYFDLKMHDWLSVILVPEKNIEADNSNFTQSIVKDIALVFSITLIFIVCFFIIMWKSTIEGQKRAAEAERKSNEAKTSFLSSMSHDIRTPMNAIIGMTEIALHHKDDPKQMADNLEKIRLSSSHMLTLINDILDISKIESGKMPLNIAEFSLVDATNTFVNLIRSQAKAKEIDLRVHTHDYKQEYVIGDDLRISQVCINLTTNAIKYTPRGGRVDVDLREEILNSGKVRLVFTVKDTGIGMSKEFQDIMYDAFSRATDSRVNKVAGTGLGLAICRQIVQLMDGTLECESEEGKGTTFTAKLTLNMGKSDENYKLPPMRVLVFDHDPVSTEALSSILERLNVKADVFTDPKELPTDWQKANKYKAAIIELGVPSNVGLSLTRLIHKELGEDFPVILSDIANMTEYSSEIKAVNAAMTMNKPYFYRTVYEALNGLFGTQSDDGKNRQEAKPLSIEGVHVLVAEDNDLNWEILSELLEMNGVTADRADDGKACIEMLDAAQPDTYAAILMDVRMPVMDGREATQRIRKSEKEWQREIPIVAMTADAFAEDVQACLKAGMNVHLSKPINIKKLIAILSEILHPRQ